ncbi:ferritin [Salmonella enterica subsp. enterica serovar Gaminara str. ATCC BAA-711]|nr:ferritin [Salmonella enterica subsp. enterica serovar Gaminara str. ATCC BAA-711]
MTSQDYPTFNFLQWYVAEQHEEENCSNLLLIN